MNIQIIQICPHSFNKNTQSSKNYSNPSHLYTAIAIEEGGRFYYWAKGASIEIDRQEYEYIKTNPKLYYFSTALKLHCKIEKLINSKSF